MRDARLKFLKRDLPLLLLFLALPLFFVAQDHRSLLTALNAPGHILFFALLAAGLARLRPIARLSFAGQAAVILASVFVLGGTVELIQPHFGRSARWQDLGIDIAGTLAGLLFLAPARRSLPTGALALGQFLSLAVVLVIAGSALFTPAVTIADTMLAKRQFPMLGGFESHIEASRWQGGTIDRTIARHGKGSFRVQLAAKGHTGAALRRRLGDWRGYSAMAVSIHNPGPDSLELTIAVVDQDYRDCGGRQRDRFARRVLLQPGWNDLEFPMGEIENAPEGRKLDLSRIVSVLFTARKLPEPVVIHIDSLRLVIG
jgi:hypothetical protein